MKSFVKAGNIKGLLLSGLVVIVILGVFMTASAMMPEVKEVGDNATAALGVINDGVRVAIDGVGAVVSLGQNVVNGFKSGV